MPNGVFLFFGDENMTNLIINTTRARKDYKQLIGQTNHFLITILVGLDGINTGRVSLNPSFSTSWNPQNMQTSALRSRHFAIKATLAWCVDALDGYFVMACEEPDIVQDSTLIHTSLNEKSIFRKFKAFNNKYSANLHTVSVEAALIEVAITWRNRLIHFNSDNSISATKRSFLIRQKSYIQTNYQGLDIEVLLDNYDGYKNPPRFKEVTALIRAIHKYVEVLDAAIIGNINYNNYAHAIIKHYLNEDNGQLKDKRINGIWSRDIDTTKRKIINILKGYGFEEVVQNTRLSINNTNNLVTLDVKSARSVFN
ncbi:hypothetical protein BABA_10466 [Neobacillus bataviensis LMG 21833]|uniref:Uncharacterized protein n=2 Tax=Neobacillus bataviensis TaxID=220685 RepID=K6DLT5_9BACI|nr:hypothetical protein BABA_10466 [Neobacillus bataviensis LMG 21833]